MKPTPSKREVNRQRWLEHIQAWQRSGLKQKAFCEQHRLRLASFQRWLGIVRAEEKNQAEVPVTFLPVSVSGCTASSLTLHFNNKLQLDIPADFDPALLKQVIQVLQNA